MIAGLDDVLTDEAATKQQVIACEDIAEKLKLEREVSGIKRRWQYVRSSLFGNSKRQSRKTKATSSDVLSEKLEIAEPDTKVRSCNHKKELNQPEENIAKLEESDDEEVMQLVKTAGKKTRIKKSFSEHKPEPVEATFPKLEQKCEATVGQIGELLMKYKETVGGAGDDDTSAGKIEMSEMGLSALESKCDTVLGSVDELLRMMQTVKTDGITTIPILGIPNIP